jgi:bifunctional DNA-binding transcriptional regulator/antitoxin component of YhaV-PrlF toxin-antitoxin module
MRERIEFDTSADSEGRIDVPAEYRKELRSRPNLHVTIEERTRRDKRDPAAFVRRAQEHPIAIPGFKPLTRDELYDE